MRIGFIKFGLKTYFDKNGTGQGSNHELVSIFDIFEKRGHECFMISGSDKYENFEDIESLDHIFVFNGPNSFYSLEGMCLLRNYTLPYVKILNATKVPWSYFWTDARKTYNVMENPNITNKPTHIFSQEKEYYGHLDKIVLYNKEFVTCRKDIKFAVLMNDTDAKRNSVTIKTLNWIRHDFPIQLVGKWKKKYIEKDKISYIVDPVAEEEVQDFLNRVKYSWNTTVNSFWTSQKYWEMILSDVICFHHSSDLDNLIMTDGDFKRVMDEVSLEEKIDLLEKNPLLYQEFIAVQRELVRPEYINGDFLYETITNRLNV